jgi:RNA-directed DNA polymerase
MKHKGYRRVRYADDFVLLCRSLEEAQAALEEVKAWVEANGLSLGAEKTHVGDCRQPGQGFDFLGYHFELGRRWARKKSYQALQDRIGMRTKRTRGDSLAKITADLNPALRGWFNYFKHAHPNTFKWMDSFVRRRLRAVLRKHMKRPGRGVCREDHQRWPNQFFAAQGLFTMTTAWKLASQSR